MKSTTAVTYVDPQVEADIAAYHRGVERAAEGVEIQEPRLPADSPEIRRELDFDLASALQQGAI